MLILKSLLSYLLIVSLPVVAQKLKKADKVIVNNLQSHISYLADDKLEGRRAGTHGEMMAREYIRIQFQKTGLEPKGDNGSYYQAFDIWEGKNFTENSYLIINGEKISTDDYFPLPSSPKTSIEASPSIALKEAAVPWFLDIKEDMAASENNPHFSLTPYLVDKAKNASRKGATALIIYNSNEEAGEQKYDARERAEPTPIPVVVVTNKVSKKYFNDETATLVVKLNIEFKDSKRIGHNVIGYINNGAAHTTVLGAHYDHLGFGEDGNSLLHTAEKLVHNGADDNASGTAALIELSRLLKSSRLKNNNYLFIAFSGEEIGLFGSKYFVDNPTVDLSKTNYMINMDMIGRLNENTKVLNIGGLGTSPLWPRVFSTISTDRYFVHKFDSSGTGPSDHNSFYKKDIPVLFFFTGLHSDYHKPTDDFDKVNYPGQLRIVQYIYKVIEATNKTGKLSFVKTREQPMGTTTRFSVTMGIMPDYTFNGKGVRVDGVSEGRPAQKAGLKVGDVVIQLGDYQVVSVENYMQALNKFKKGDKTTVKVKRDNDTVEAEIIF